MTEPEPRCPKCGADQQRSPFRYQRAYECGSVEVADSGGTWVFVSQSDACRIDQQAAVIAAQDAELERLRGEVERLRMKLSAADAMANAIDELVRRRALNSRSVVSDRRLDYGEPWQYEFIDHVPFSPVAALARPAEQEPKP